MVKNTTGGNKTKSFARKNASSGHSSALRLPDSPLEHFAIVSKILGNGMCYVRIHAFPNTNFICHIRKKFSGRFKKDNLISVGTFLLVGLREWESIPSNCDVIEVYNHSDLALLNTLPNFLLSSDTVSKQSTTEAFVFDENAEEDEIVPIETNHSTMVYDEPRESQINIDDI